MIGFLGEYEVTLDAKGRFLIPAAFKKQLADDSASQFASQRLSTTHAAHASCEYELPF